MGASIGKLKAAGLDNWSEKVYFDPEADKTSDKTLHLIADEDLRLTLKDLIDIEERIIKVSVYKIPLFDKLQLTNVLFNHQYVVIKTDASMFWSLEKNNEGITIQRSPEEHAVLKRYRQADRVTSRFWDVVQLVIEDEANKTLNDLTTFLWRKDLLHYEYNLVSANCKDFSRIIFNELAFKKTMAPALIA